MSGSSALSSTRILLDATWRLGASLWPFGMNRSSISSFRAAVGMEENPEQVIRCFTEAVGALQVLIFVEFLSSVGDDGGSAEGGGPPLDPLGRLCEVL